MHGRDEPGTHQGGGTAHPEVWRETAVVLCPAWREGSGGYHHVSGCGTGHEGLRGHKQNDGDLLHHIAAVPVEEFDKLMTDV